MKWFPSSMMRYFLILAFLTLGGLTGCDESGDGGETVHLHVFNGYPGSTQISLYGPSGTVITGLSFSDQTIDPIKIDRNLGTEFTLVIDGAPQTIDLGFPLYDMFPQETGMLFLKRRSDTSSAVPVIYRHVPSISTSCRLVIDNALSVREGALALHNFMAAFHLPNIADAGYVTDERGSGFLAQVQAFPYFFLVDHPEINNALMYVWAGTNPDDPTVVDYSSGTVMGHRPTWEFLDCLGDDDTPEAIEDCSETVNYSGHAYEPDEVETYTINFPPKFDGSSDCDHTFRIYSDFSNIFTGEHGNGQYIEESVSFEPADHQFWVLFGRPVDPQVATWTSSSLASGGGFAPLPDYPSTTTD
ncbi:MAG: hypothetical protein ACNA8W_02175 [Bradymonadaceae bacterium]